MLRKATILGRYPFMAPVLTFMRQCPWRPEELYTGGVESSGRQGIARQTVITYST